MQADPKPQEEQPTIADFPPPIGAPAAGVDLPLWNEADGDDELHPHDEGHPAAAFPAQAGSAPAQELPTIGHIGRYALKYRIGEGGLGTVYAAHDPLLARLIAIKTLNVAVSPEARMSFDALFMNEARAAGSLSHPHIVTVYDAGVSERGPYIAMELLRGRDLRQLRQEGWRASLDQAAMVVRRVADALGYAHARGVVHCDIKPANIFMVGRTQPRVLDFGIARVAHQQDLLSDDSVAAGSPYYMAPEQLRSGAIDRRTDVFSLGVVLYELLTGSKPFKGDTLAEITAAVLNHRPPPANDAEPGVPAALSAIAARAMEKNPDDRYRSARAMSRDLRRWLDEHSQPDATAPVPPATTAATGRRRAFAAATAVAVAAAGLWFVRADSGSPSVAAAPPGAAVASGSPPAPAAAPPSPADTSASPGPPGAAPELADAVGAAAESSSAGAPASATSAQRVPAPRAQAAPAGRPPRTAVRSPQRAVAAREARADAPRPATEPAAPAATGLLLIAVSPWGEIEVDGRPAGVAPPLTQLSLPAGPHTVTVRNPDFPPRTVTIDVSDGQPVTVKHKF